MTALKDLLLHQIRAQGPMTVASFMSECLLHPRYGYYTTRQPFGQQGDFVTAPEISQMFGELLGLALAQAWLDQGAPHRVTLAELGPGRGALMADVLRATRKAPGFHAAVDIVLFEASAKLREAQKTALKGYNPRWIDRLEDLPDQPLFLLANEFFDALPVRQYQRGASGWQERLIGIRNDNLCFGLSDVVALAETDRRFEGDPEGTVVERRPDAALYLRPVAARIHRHGGLALIADYGGWRSKADTLQALRSHAFADPLAAPGQADLTAHVDFEALALAAPDLAHAYAPQGAVLRALGIEARSLVLARNLSGPALDNHLAAARRLTAPSEMGELFKILALYPKTAAMPPGFA